MYRISTLPMINSAWRLTRPGIHPWVLGTAETPSTVVHLTLKKVKGYRKNGHPTIPVVALYHFFVSWRLSFSPAYVVEVPHDTKRNMSGSMVVSGGFCSVQLTILHAPHRYQTGHVEDQR